MGKDFQNRSVNKMHEDRYLDLRALSEYSSISVSTLRDYLHDPDNPIPSYCIRRKILVRQSEFDQWIKQHRVDNSQLTALVDEVVNELTAPS